MLTDTQKKAAFAIVNIFETGSVLGDYGNVTLIPNDPGHLTYGRSQTTLAAGGGPGNLGELLEQYCGQAGARFARLLQPYVPRVKQGDLALDNDMRLKNVLRACADDAVMRDTQDAFFEKRYWTPAANATSGLGFGLPLSFAVVYDSFIHGSWQTIRARTDEAAGRPAAIGEKTWIAEYVKQRRNWLATHSNPVLHPTVYRMDAFQRLIDHDLWNLETPFVVRGLEISTESLAALPANCYVGPAPGSRALGLQTPLLRGLDVRLLQLALSEAGCDVVADGIFGKGSVAALAARAARVGEPASAVVDAALVMQLAATVA